MVTFEVNDMTCGHCVNAITKAVAFVDPGAKVQVDLASHRVQIEPTASTVAVLGDAIMTAGYTPVEVAKGAVMPTSAAPRKGCCCG
ncbi:MAG: heavy-metal-associated domain-containing protein [Pseudomonadota bacterium]